MKKLYILFFLFVTFWTSSYGQSTYTAIANGDWHDPSIWSPLGVPGIGDTALIKSQIVRLRTTSGHVQVDSIYIDNSSGVERGVLRVDSNAQLSARTVHLVGMNVAQNARFRMFAGSSVNITGDLLLERTADNNTETITKIYVEKALLNIDGNLIFNYENTDSGTDKILQVQDSSEVNVLGNVEINIKGGTIVKINLVDSKMYIAGNLSLNSTVSNLKLRVKLLDNAVLDIDGNVVYQAQSDRDVAIRVFSSELKLAGALQRPNDYGYLLIDSLSLLTYDGTSPQIIAPDKETNSGLDSFDIANVTFANTSGAPMILTGDLTITDHLELTKGIFKTTDSTMLILEDSATISTGNATAYIDGPMIKKGSTMGSSFLFPLGNSGVYAPLEISQISNSKFAYQAQYFSEPPPIEDGIGPSVSNVSGSGYWDISKSTGADDVDVTLHWSDAEASGIQDPDSLLVVGLTDNGVTKTWESYGNGATTGGTGSGVSGSVTNNYAEPPPLDEVTKLTLGSTSDGANALPVIISRFGAIQEGESIRLDWETIVEENADQFIIERSSDGIHFAPIGAVKAYGNQRGTNYYSFLDEEPATGLNYYRLKQVDFDGSYSYSEIVVLTIQTKALDLNIFPNPLYSESITINGFTNKHTGVQVEVRDQTGRVLFIGMLPVRNGEIKTTASNLQLFKQGIYYLLLTNNEMRMNVQLIKLE